MTQPPDTIEAALAEQWDREPAPMYWESWRPAVGQRVRVTLSPECKIDWGDNPLAIGHPDALNGATGEVIGYMHAERWPHHPWHVWLDDVIHDVRDGVYFNGCYLSAWELEPVEPAPEAQPSGAADEGEA